MAVYVVTGNLGSGKTLVCVGKIRDYLYMGRRVATNLDLKLELLCEDTRSPDVVRLPDFPSSRDLHYLGIGNPTTDESRNGLIVLDEAGGWLNSRGWQEGDREATVRWFMHARKLGWDVFLIVQDISLVDKQVRVAFCEHVVRCKRLDRFSMPFIGPIFTFVGTRLSLPQIHIGNVFYGLGPNATVVDRWVYRGRDLWRCYKTRQIFTQDGPGLHEMLLPHRYPWMCAPSRWRWGARLKGWLRRAWEAVVPLSDAEIGYRCFRLAEEYPGLFAGLRPHAPSPPTSRG